MTDITRIALLGADGRMGQALTRLIAADAGLQLVAGLSAPNSPNLNKDLGELAGFGRIGVMVSADIEAGLATADVLIDFSSPAASVKAAQLMENSPCRAMVCGTTGLTDSDMAALTSASQNISLVQSGNFSLGVNMLQALVELAAQKLPDWDVEVLEMHHSRKVDAPSGTALMLGEAAAKGRGQNLADHATLSREGQTGERNPETIGFAALRGGGVIGDHDVHLAADLEMITLSHRAFDRNVFASGAIAAACWASTQQAGLYDMRDVLGLSSLT